jgi:uncharacterized protein with HEPN domain
MKDSDLQKLKYIRGYCNDINATIIRFGNSYETFSNDIVYKNSVAMSIIQIGELAGSLSDEFKEKTSSQMQWGVIRGMRNLIEHSYTTLNIEDIWEVATKDIPALSKFCDEIISKNRDEINNDVR